MSYHDPAYWIWCGSPLRDEQDDSIHLFASRWSKAYSMHPGWLYHSTIVRATAPAPDAPFSFVETVLGPRDPAYFDGRCAHNPCIRHWDNRYYLFYSGTTYEGEPGPDWRGGGPQYQRVWSSKRIGVAVANSPAGPWRRPEQPLLQPRPGHWDALITTNPAPWIDEDGRTILIYKSRTVLGGPRQLGVAIADHPLGPYRYPRETPLFDGADLEDACLWHADGTYWLMFKDFSGRLCGLPGGAALARSEDGVEWTMADPPFVHQRQLTDHQGRCREYPNAERGQVLLEAGRPRWLFTAVSYGGQGLGDATDTWNLAVPWPWHPASSKHPETAQEE